MRPPLVVRTLLALAGSVGLVLGLLVALPAQALAPSAAERYVAAVHARTDAARASNDRAPLARNACLHRAAQRQAERMARDRALSHTGDLGAIQRRCGVSAVGENVAAGYPTGRAVVRGWMHSEGHRENILRPQYRLLGAAAVRSRGTWWAVQVFGGR